MAIPTLKATLILSPCAYSSIAACVVPIRSPLAATLAASAATAINAGSATVVPKPRQNAKINNQPTLPLRANACAIDSPIGNKPCSRP